MMRLWKPLVALALVGAMACGGSSSGSGNGDGLGTGGTGGDAGQDGGSGGTAGTDGTGGSGGIGGTGGIAEDIGELSIEITGLPEGVEAAVSVKGPGGFRAQLTESEVLTELEAGRYTITSEVVSNDDTPYFPSASSLQVDVEEGETAEVVITYQEGEFALVMPERVSLALSRSVDFEVEVRREEGFAVDVRAVGVLPEGLKLEHRRLSLGPDQERASFTLLNVANESEALLEEAVLLTFEAEIEEAELRVQATVEVEVLPWVTDAGDDGPGTIRELSAALTAMSAAPTLRFDPEVFSNGTTIPLDSPIVIDGSLAIEGIMVGEPPVPAVGMEANGSHPLFVIEGGDVRIARLSIRDGQAERGGCIQNFGNLVVEEVHLTDCHATDRGGAIANLTNDEGKVGSLEILGSLITENSADERAGGVYSEGNLLVQESEISRNTEAGIYLDNVSGAKGVTLRIQKSQITKNLSKNWGGGVFTEGELVGTITQSELSENEGERGGGALYTKEGGRWTIQGSVVSKNKGDGNGGGLSFAVGTVGATIRNTEIQGNQSGADGGGIFNYPSTSKLALENSVVSENKAYANGGGIYSNGPVEATTTTVEDNDAAAWSDEGGNGGGIYVSGEAAELDLVQSTVSNNSAYPGGGGVYSLGARATFTNSTIAGNYAAEGGGILISGEQALFLHSTVSNNQGGGIGIASAPGGKLFLSGTIVANNVAQQAPDIYNGRTPGDITTGGYNLIGVRNGSGVAEDDFDATDLFGTTAAKLDPKLEPLGDYGGPTPTMPPKADSPAIDKAGPCHSSIILAVKIDQRGETRPLGSACDIGAVEAH